MPPSRTADSSSHNATPITSGGREECPTPFVVCSGCGLPPRRNPQGNILPLRKCTRCGKVAYHNVQCQTKHYPMHKKACRQANGRPVCSSSPESLYCIQRVPNKGQGMMAAHNIATGQSITHHGGSSTMAPLVPPVLFHNQRNSRCAICFGITLPEQRIILCHDPRYVVQLCRPCHAEDPAHVLPLLKHEVEVVQATPQIPKILPTAILIFRLYWAVTHQRLGWEAILDRMAHPTAADEPVDAVRHEQAVILTVVTFLRSATSHNLHVTQEMSRIQGILSRIKVNAFTLTHDDTAQSGEALSLGLGLFHQAHFINHSCIPNTRQSFTVGIPGQSPALHLTAQANIATGEEITISYLDTNQRTTQERQTELQESYRFTCRCLACENRQRT